MTEKPSVYEDYDKTEDSKTNGDSPIEGLELCFSSIDFRPEFDAAEEMLIDNDMQIELVLEIEAFPQGKGFRTLNDSWEDKNEILGKNIKAVITIIIGKKSKGRTDVLHSFLNGVKRKMTLDPGAASSFILNTKNPRKSRIFKITKVSKNYLHDIHESTHSYWSDDEDESDSDDSMGYETSLAFDTEGWIEPPMDGLELIFCSRDIWIELNEMKMLCVSAI